MDDPTAAANFKALVEKELRERTFARFGITDPSQMRIIQDIPNGRRYLGKVKHGDHQYPRSRPTSDTR